MIPPLTYFFIKNYVCSWVYYCCIFLFWNLGQRDWQSILCLVLLEISKSLNFAVIGFGDDVLFCTLGSVWRILLVVFKMMPGEAVGTLDFVPVASNCDGCTFGCVSWARRHGVGILGTARSGVHGTLDCVLVVTEYDCCTFGCVLD